MRERNPLSVSAVLEEATENVRILLRFRPGKGETEVYTRRWLDVSKTSLSSYLSFKKFIKETCSISYPFELSPDRPLSEDMSFSQTSSNPFEAARIPLETSSGLKKSFQTRLTEIDMGTFLRKSMEANLQKGQLEVKVSKIDEETLANTSKQSLFVNKLTSLLRDDFTKTFLLRKLNSQSNQSSPCVPVAQTSSPQHRSSNPGHLNPRVKTTSSIEIKEGEGLARAVLEIIEERLIKQTE